MSYINHIAPRSTPQSSPLFNRQQVENSAGGYVFKLDPFERLRRFLILGCEGGTYYATEQKLTVENAKCVSECAAIDHVRTINLIVDVSTKGLAPKNDPAVFALAICASIANDDCRRYARRRMHEVCRISTHLFQFVEAVNELCGWGRGLKRAVSNWYLTKSPTAVAVQVTKYQQRNGWSHRDVLRLAHPHSHDASINDAFRYVTQYDKWKEETNPYTIPLLQAVEEAKTADVKRICELIRENGLVREHIPTEHLNNVEVWEALFDDMPITATIRNLNKMTQIGLFKPLGQKTREVCERLTTPSLLKSGRVHPFALLVALKTYASGRGFRGDLAWTPVPQIVSALEDAYYLAFDAIVPTGKNWLFGIDVSGSMGDTIQNTNVSCRSAAACLAMTSFRTEPNSYAFGFTSRFEDLRLHSKMSLAEVEKSLNRCNFGSTDCAVPMLHATRERLEVDAFVVLTDNETWAGKTHPCVALEEYRQRMGRNAKLIVVGMTATNFSIADPNDVNSMDVVGFDASAPAVMADFVR